jgi:cytosine/adenosine deaminase-related metal-dependent hydrolase
MSRAGINLALGMDSNSFNDDNDMLQEMRLALNLQKSSGEFTGGIDYEQVFSMATKNAARTIGMEDKLGVLKPGMAADVVLLCYDQISYPFVAAGQNCMNTLVQRAKANHVDSVIINGKLVMKEGRILTIDKAALVKEIQDQLIINENKQNSRPDSWVKKMFPYIIEYLQNKMSGR